MRAYGVECVHMDAIAHSHPPQTLINMAMERDAFGVELERKGKVANFL